MDQWAAAILRGNGGSDPWSSRTACKTCRASSTTVDLLLAAFRGPSTDAAVPNGRYRIRTSATAAEEDQQPSEAPSYAVETSQPFRPYAYPATDSVRRGKTQSGRGKWQVYPLG